jgi:cysteinyl-tRNA synthetase
MVQRFHNTLTRETEEFRPGSPPEVSLYACGPTVYKPVHVGNWSATIFFDVAVRWLRESGWRVRYVSNITDVEDKIIRDAQREGVSREALTARYTDLYLRERERLGCLAPDHEPRATEHVEGMRRMIQTLLDKGNAYLADDGSIYFRIASFPTYGRLANLTPGSLRAGGSGRMKADEYEKESVGDFALWKGYDPSDGDVFWEPEFTIDGRRRVVKGRPGWHIECSVMSTALLGVPIDLHLGGEDLKFPHHQNEIAQSEAATGTSPFVRTWLHRRHLLVDGQKMSKSKGNFYTLADLVEREGEGAPRAFRYLVVSAHYRTPIDFSWQALRAAAATLRNLTDARARLARFAGDTRASTGGPAAEAVTAFRKAMEDDLEAAGAMAAIHTMVHELNRRADAGTLSAGDAAAGVEVLDLADRSLGLGLTTRRALTPEEESLVAQRLAARGRRDFAEADRLRGALAKRGVAVKDTKEGQDVSFL